MNSDFSILEKHTGTLGSIIDAVPDKVFVLDGGIMDSLSILERRMPDGMLKRALSDYNRIFSKSNHVTVEDICTAAGAYIKIKVLAERQESDVNAYSLEILKAEYQQAIQKTNKLISLTNIQKQSLMGLPSDEIQQRIDKYYALIEGYNRELTSLSDICIKEPDATSNAPDSSSDIGLEVESSFMPTTEAVETAYLNEGEQPESAVSTSEADPQPDEAANPTYIIRQPVPVPESPAPKIKKSLFSFLSGKKKDVSASQTVASSAAPFSNKRITSCGEKPFNRRFLVFDEYVSCKDLPTYILLKAKQSIYFGAENKISGNRYDNTDGSLYILTAATDDFMQFMSVDLLSGEYELRPFSPDEKYGLQLYFNFMMTTIKNMDISYRTNEKSAFLKYYNQLLQTIWKMENQVREDLSRARLLCETYESYMSCFNYPCIDDTEHIIDNLLLGDATAYISDIQTVIDSFVTEAYQKKMFITLMNDLKYFVTGRN